MQNEPRANVRTFLFYVASAAIPLGVFGYFFHWQILIPTNATWLLQGDWGASVIGWNAFRHDVWRWPLGFTQLLAWPYGAPVIYTDSNPLLCLLLKPFSAVLPTPFQFTGIWFLSCIVLQFAAGYALLRDTQSRWLRLIGATLLTVVPTLINRMPHANLCAHWTILLSLYVFVNVEREARRDLGYGAILVISALVHPYLLVMNASIWASDAVRRSVGSIERRAFRELTGLAARTAAVALAPVAALWAIGGLGGYQGGAAGFGYFSMSLDALINPGTVGYSRFFPVAPQGPYQTFEGFQYLGAGLIATVVAALATLATRSGRDELRRMEPLMWLAPAMLVLSLLALSDHIQLHGQVVRATSYDWIPFHLTEMFRSSGRLFWPCTYLLLLVSLKLVFSLPRAWPLVISLAAVALQFADLTGFATAARAQTAEAVLGPRYPRTPSPTWEKLIASAEVVEFQPPDPHLDQKVFYEIAWRASSIRRPVNVMYTARTKPQQQAFESASRRRFLVGELNPKHLYVLNDGCVPRGLDPSRLKQVDRIVVIPPAGAQYPFTLRSAPAPAPFPIGRTVDRDAPEFRCMLGQDWSRPEDWGVWSDGPAPELLFRLGSPPDHDLLLRIVAGPFQSKGQSLSVVVGGRTIERLALTGEAAPYEIRVPKQLAAGPLLAVRLQLGRPQAPSAPGGSADSRFPGVGLRSVRLDPAL